jgi:hypothetical protein
VYVHCSSLTGQIVDRTGLPLRDKVTRNGAYKCLEAGTKSFGSLGTNKLEVSANSYYFYYHTFSLSTYMHAYIHTHTYIHTHIHTYIPYVSQSQQVVKQVTKKKTNTHNFYSVKYYKNYQKAILQDAEKYNSSFNVPCGCRIYGRYILTVIEHSTLEVPVLGHVVYRLNRDAGSSYVLHREEYFSLPV